MQKKDYEPDSNKKKKDKQKEENANSNQQCISPRTEEKMMYYPICFALLTRFPFFEFQFRILLDVIDGTSLCVFLLDRDVSIDTELYPCTNRTTTFIFRCVATPKFEYNLCTYGTTFVLV